MFGFPAAATKVGNQSNPDTMLFSTLPAGTRPGEILRPVVRREHNNGVLVETVITEFFHHSADDVVELSETSFGNGPTVLGIAHILVFFREVRDNVHARWVEPDKKRLVFSPCLVNEVDGLLENFVIDRLHPLRVER